MSNRQLEKRAPSRLKEKGQYVLAFGVIAAMLVAANFPIFVILFFGLFGYFILKMFAGSSRSETRDIFEFYLSANEILRDDDRRWYGFELNEAVGRGEEIIQRMSSAPPLVHFALGALYNKAGDHKRAEASLAFIVENDSSQESAYVFPTPELRNYVKVLRKIEREPADAPLTSAAVRALERARKLRAKTLLEISRQKLAAETAENSTGESDRHQLESALNSPVRPAAQPTIYSDEPVAETNGKKNNDSKPDPFGNRKPITEVLHDIYDDNIQ